MPVTTLYLDGLLGMPKSAADPFFATNQEPITAARRAQVVSASATDLPTVTSSLLVTVTTAGSITVLMANDLDTNPISHSSGCRHLPDQHPGSCC
jgi:hypothetical protein